MHPKQTSNFVVENKHYVHDAKINAKIIHDSIIKINSSFILFLIVVWFINIFTFYYLKTVYHVS